MPQTDLKSQPEVAPKPHGASPWWRRDRLAEGHLYPVGAVGTSGHRDALGGCSIEEMGFGIVLHATLAIPCSQETLRLQPSGGFPHPEKASW